MHQVCALCSSLGRPGHRAAQLHACPVLHSPWLAQFQTLIQPALDPGVAVGEEKRVSKEIRHLALCENVLHFHTSSAHCNLQRLVGRYHAP